LDLCRQLEVLLGEAARVMSDESEPDAIVANVDVGMVAGLFCKCADTVHEAERGNEILELECADELAGLDLPAGQLSQAGLSGIRGKGGHGEAPKDSG